MEENLQKSIVDLNKLLQKSLEGKTLTVELNWNISEKTIAEIGGRLLEDYILTVVPEVLKKNKSYFNKIKSCIIPKSQRSMEDIEFLWKDAESEISFTLLVDIKGHNEKKKGSRPNLASIRKCRELYSGNENDKELLIFFCRYNPEVINKNDKTIISYNILDSSFDDKSIFLIRHLSDRNLDPADIGSGGQILLARENEITLVKRSRKEFVKLLDNFSSRISYTKAMKSKKY